MIWNNFTAHIRRHFCFNLAIKCSCYYLLFYMDQLNYYSSSSIYVTVHSYFKNVSQPTGSYK